jgi:opacity protein-like surface antigen
MYRPSIRRVFAVCSIIVTCLWMGGAAFAEAGDQGNQTYLGLGAGFGFENFDDTGGLDIDDAYGFDVWGGYRFVPHVAAEAQLEYLNGFDASIFGIDLDGQALAVTGNVKVFPFANLSDRVEPFLYAGMGVGWFEIDAGPLGDTDEADFIGRFGGGIDLYLSQNVALQVSSSYVLTTGDLDGLDWVSLVAGLQFRF